MQIAKEEEEAKHLAGESKKKDDLPNGEVSEAETETEDKDATRMPPPPPRGSSLRPVPEGVVRERLSVGAAEASGYVSTDSEWDKVSDAEEKS